MPRRKQAAQLDTGEAKTPLSRRPKIVTVLRVKDEAAYIEHALRSLEPLGGEVVLLDDGSTDATADIVRSFGDVHYHWQDGLPMDEGRDRTALYRWALELEPEWILTLDGDEVLDGPSANRILAAMNGAPDDVNVFEVFMAVMASPVDAPQKQQRWFNGPSPLRFWSMDRMFRVRDADKDYKFMSNFDNNLHCGCVPDMRAREKRKLNAWIKYYGYESPEALERKRAFYSEHDPANFPRVEEMWRERVKQGVTTWRDGPCCRELSITGTVEY
ncbi:MAG: glycosyltransferase [bacterium]|nr:glycosyltransferase [bacterium]